MSYPTIATSIATQQEILLGYIGRLTGERQRPQLESVLIEALRELTHADRVAYYKLQLTADEILCWLAVEADSEGTRILDDGINLPAHLSSLDDRPEIAAAVTLNTVQTFSCATGTRVLQPVTGPGSATGFIEIDLAQAPDKQRMFLIGGLVTAFRNIMGLLDYSEVDTLTGLLNRKTFDEHLIHILSSLSAGDDIESETKRIPKRRRYSCEPASHWLAVLDIDHFKRINDNFGHLIGDEVLLLVANLMKTTFRFRDKLFRFGGEEFVVVLNPTSAENAFVIFDRFRQTMAAQVFPQVGHVTISIGFAPIRLHDQPSVILDHADQALYWSKGNGRNQVAAYESLVAEGKLQPQSAPESDVEFF
jgi:diguanylate cyclase (GGDEF)-like protein